MTMELQRLKVLGAGILSLVVMLGVARFAYTPLIPVMELHAGLGTAQSGWLATFNYIGYMCGALIAASVNSLITKDTLYRLGLIVAVLTTVGMGLTDNWLIWSILRFLAGLSSAAGLLIGSGLILNWLMRHNYHSELGIHFAGMGIGIAFCSIAVELMIDHFSWEQQWFIFSLLGVLIAIPAWRWLPRPTLATLTQQNANLQDNPPSMAFMILMMLAYFCAGVGYVISATFTVAIAERLPEVQGLGNLVFLIVGVAAAPACILWDFVARKTGILNALLIAYILHIGGFLAPILGSGLPSLLVSAVLYGFTFIGIVSLVLTMSGRFYPSKPAKMMGKMTLSYGIAQIIAPALTGQLAEQTGSFDSGLYLAVGFTALGIAFLLLAKTLGHQDLSTSFTSQKTTIQR
ncbi:YbfB/YjiJ family MFS transporter [Motiliproteus sp. MSK22-1]|uniref:YbfB/YjiJ family MFS transporter n=1 Tax=Motiliproteus sp. MSK22-1 TaxID=1897630 RepID=UPI000976AB5D|nr:YbfB/YjiJ family MFS transporter [Motiliproteus sp. MSK22-1]OMH38401.1 MFS transporter [Motiliproteus sp. MSK22-1]